MAFVTSQQLDTLYEKYKKTDVTFTKDVTRSLRMVQNQTHLKYQGGQRSCVVYSSSLCGSKIMIVLPNKLLAKLQTSRLVYLRYCFQKEDSSDTISFIVHSRIVGFTRYGDNKEVYFAQLEYTHRPPDALIEILGAMLDANVNSRRRKEERIIIDTNSMRRLNLVSAAHTVRIGNESRNGLIRDISFSGLKIIILGSLTSLIGKKATVQLSQTFGRNIVLTGEVVRHETVENQVNLAAIALHFEPEDTPLEYRILISDCLKHPGVARVDSPDKMVDEKLENPRPQNNLIDYQSENSCRNYRPIEVIAMPFSF